MAVLNGSDVYTVFAPTNSAFDKPPASLLTGDLVTTLLYHVVAGNFTAAEILVAGTLTTVQGRSITIAMPGDWVNDYAQLVTVNVPCSNGVVHIIDSVLIAEDTSLAAVAGLAGLNTLLSLATAANLADQLADVTSPNAVTLWAPTDAAFTAFFSTNVGSWVAAPRNSASVAEVLKFHVVPSDGVFFRELADGQTYATATGESVKVRIDGNGLAILDNTNGAAFVETPDLVGFNGVAHIVDRVLVPSTLPWENLDDIVTLAQATPDLSTLVDQLGVAQYVAPLQLPNGPFTVLAPNNDAFTAAGADLPTTIPELQQLFGDHVLVGRLYASDLKNQSYNTIGGGAVDCVVGATAVTFSDDGITATVLLADVDASNGVVHVIDTVLLAVARASASPSPSASSSASASASATASASASFGADARSPIRTEEQNATPDFERAVGGVLGAMAMCACAAYICHPKRANKRLAASSKYEVVEV